MSEADGLADEDDVDPAGQFLVHLENLADGAVLPVRGLRAGVLEDQAVLVDPLVRCFQRQAQLLRADNEDDVGGSPCAGRELAAGGGRGRGRRPARPAVAVPG